MNWTGMEGGGKRENDKCLLEEKCVEWKTRNLIRVYVNRMKELIMENDVNEMIRRRE